MHPDGGRLLDAWAELDRALRAAGGEGDAARAASVISLWASECETWARLLRQAVNDPIDHRSVATMRAAPVFLSRAPTEYLATLAEAAGAYHESVMGKAH